MRAEPDTGNGAEPGETVNGSRPPARADGADADTPPAAPSGASAPAARASRRFPSVTHDTARPEGSGRAIPGAVSAPARQWPMLSVLAATAAGLLSTAFGHPRVGCLIIGVALIAAAVMRRLLPSVGMLAVRSRFTDMITYGVLGVAITLLALVMEPKPLLNIPFLESAVRFTVR
ncbi:DUF3017 domain-containing protein [Streptomyces sp. RerS4]|uniref:DUF3017 domain-containing protein n=1 Tax=Streptomyces sp. RerS4 TaxID=2942449 RepID=UPI00201BD2EB|nr:DUF3017 domain-containing protein [Streptomyces sp. RerS4]UQX02623.1 DUF3017 domain-containing protein [Streptomyces sp. RerS4]